MRFLRFFLVLLLLSPFGCAPKSQPSTPGQSTPGAPQSKRIIKFPKDDLGREVKLSSPAARVVCIGPGATETIFALGAGEKLVGRDQFSDYPKEALKVPVAGDYNGPFVEKVVALKPDLVIVQGETYDKTRADNWQKKIGAPLAVLVPTGLERIGHGIQLIGAWLGEPVKARKLAAPLVRLPYPDVILRPTLFEVQRSPLWVAGSGTLISSMLSYMGVNNIAEFHGYKQFSKESLMARQPEIYIVTSQNPDRKRVLEELRADPVLGKLKCVRKGHVVVLDSDVMLRPGPRLIGGLQDFEKQLRAVIPGYNVGRVHSIMN